MVIVLGNPVGALDAWVQGGRWGRRRVRVGECWRELRAEDLYTELVRSRTVPPCGHRKSVAISVDGVPFRVSIELRPNAIWRTGRVFLVCPKCGSLRTRLYLASESSWQSSCRVCLGLTYESRTLYNYKASGSILGGFVFSHRDVARARARRVRDDRAEASSLRQAERRRLVRAEANN